jgi:hypothetical protein
VSAGSARPATGQTAILAALDWDALAATLDARGAVRLPHLLTTAECVELRACYTDDARFRSTVVMARHGFGSGEYRYFDYPLPAQVSTLRQAFYPHLASFANRWQERLGGTAAYPATLDAFLAQCRASGQQRATPLLLRYRAGDYNCLHRDLYGECVFPLQLTILLSAPGAEFTGGEFVVTEQRPRQQSRVEVVSLAQGDAVLFAVNERPQTGVRGTRRVGLRHGVSRVQAGERLALGIIFHDA